MNTEIRKILVIRFSSLGDIVMATPMIRCLRKAYPLAQIDMVVRADFLELIQNNPHLDQKIGLERGKGIQGLQHLKRRIQKEHYDLIYDAHRSLRTVWLMPFLKAGYKCYFQKNYVKRNLTLAFKVPLLKNPTRMMEKYIEPLIPFGVGYDGQGPEIHLKRSESNTIDSLKNWSRIDKYPLVGLIPSAQWPGKRWSAKKFRALLVQLLETYDYCFVVFGGREDTFCESICRDLPENRVLNLQGKVGIAEAAAVISQCRFVVSNDTGMMHVADALNVPSVLVLGPTSKELGCLPFHPQSQIVEKDLWCRPCSKNGQAPCIRRKRYCMEEISVDDVYRAVTLLNSNAELAR